MLLIAQKLTVITAWGRSRGWSCSRHLLERYQRHGSMLKCLDTECSYFEYIIMLFVPIVLPQPCTSKLNTSRVSKVSKQTCLIIVQKYIANNKERQGLTRRMHSSIHPFVSMFARLSSHYSFPIRFVTKSSLNARIPTFAKRTANPERVNAA